MISYVNILRSLAIIGVVIIHSSGPLLSRIDNMSYWWIGDILNGAVRWCVPVFVMISGMLLLKTRENESLQIFLKKRASKIVIPFVGWILFYTIWKYKSDLGSVSIPAAVKEMISGNVYFHLWFLYMIVGLYMITPLFRVVLAHSDRRLIEYYLLIWFITSSLFTIGNHFLSIRVGLQLQYFSGYLGYFILGYYLHHIELTKRVRKLIYVCGVVGILITILGTFVGTEAKGGFEGYFYEYLSPNTVLASIAVFVFIKNIDWDHRFSRNGKFMKMIAGFSAASFGIYLVHAVVLNIIASDEMHRLVGFRINYELIHPIFGTPLTIIVVLFISFIVIWIMRKIPVIQKFVP